MLWIVLAVSFVVALFFIKSNTTFKNINVFNQGGLTYRTETLENLVNKDTDGDGIRDWEEGLWGTDPTKQETTPGTRDSVAIEKIKTDRNKNEEGKTEEGGEEKLTQTDQFARELFATISAASQSGAMDEATIDALSTSLAEKIKNPAVRKVFTSSDIKISLDESKETVRKYNDALSDMENIYKTDYTVLDVLQEFAKSENDVDASALLKLDPIIEETEQIINLALKTSTPKSLSGLHLKFINSLQKLLENMNDMKLYEKDAIVSFGALSQYDQNATTLGTDINNLRSAIEQKLNS